MCTYAASLVCIYTLMLCYYTLRSPIYICIKEKKGSVELSLYPYIIYLHVYIYIR